MRVSGIVWWRHLRLWTLMKIANWIWKVRVSYQMHAIHHLRLIWDNLAHLGLIYRPFHVSMCNSSSSHISLLTKFLKIQALGISCSFVSSNGQPISQNRTQSFRNQNPVSSDQNSTIMRWYSLCDSSQWVLMRNVIKQDRVLSKCAKLIFYFMYEK